MKKIQLLIFLVLFMCILNTVSAQALTEATEIAERLFYVTCTFIVLFKLVASSIASLVIVLQGIKWILSAEDLTSRKRAKQGIADAIIGLIIIILAVAIVEIVVAGQINMTNFDLSSC